jgi:hypothetical protein
MKHNRHTRLYALGFAAISLMTGVQADTHYPEGGDVVGRHIFGLARDYQQSPVMVNEDPLIHRSGVSHQDVQVGNRTYTVSLFDQGIGSVYLTEQGAGGEGFVDTHALDLEPVSGLTRPSGIARSPWGSLLFSESALIDAAASETFAPEMAPFFKGKTDMVSPYHYGWPAEIVLLETDDESGEGGSAVQAKVIKDYGIGRVAASRIIVMPDAKTVYLLDGKHSGILYVFVAEQANSLTQGTLYGVLFDGSRVAYHELGQGAALKTKFRLRRASFETFFEKAQPENGECPTGFEDAESVYGSECLKLEEASRPYVGLFEPIRMMALLPESVTQKMIQTIQYDSASQSLSLVQADQQERTFPLKPHSKMQSQFIMEVSP